MLSLHYHISLSLSTFFLTYIVCLIIDPSDRLGFGVSLSIPRLSHYLLGLVNLPYKHLVLVPVVTLIHLGRPHPLTDTLNPPNR